MQLVCYNIRTKGKLMVKEYNTWKEVLAALLEGKKLTQKNWHESYYIHMVNNEVVCQLNDTSFYEDVSTLPRDGWIEYLPEEEIWGWKAGDLLDYLGIINIIRYKVLFANENVVFCQLYGDDCYQYFEKSYWRHLEKVKEDQ